MRTALLYVGTSISSNGFRRIGSVTRQVDPSAQLHFVLPSDNRSILGVIGLKDYTPGLDYRSIQDVAQTFKDMDIVGVSCMTPEAEQCKLTIQEIRKINPDVFIVWGGTHAIIDPDDIIGHSDALCISEGDLAFPELLKQLINGEEYLETRNFWFRQKDGTVIKNPLRPLTTSDELDRLPPPSYGQHELIFRPGKGFQPLTVNDYLQWEALAYSTIWTRGCPFKCTYCSNSTFLQVDRGFGSIRNPSVGVMLEEVKEVLAIHPHIQTIYFNDDCLVALPEQVLRDFATQWQKEIGLPFAVVGLTPAHVTQEKIEILLQGGMNRVRMGVQSGSDRILKFFKRPNKRGLIKEKTGILGSFASTGRIIPPSYDIIVDTPIETREDIHDTLRLIQEMPRPFHLNIYSLRSIPNTELEGQLRELEESGIGIAESNYSEVAPTFANVLLFFLAVIPLPKPIFEYLLRFAAPARESAQIFGLLLIPLKFMFYSNRILSHFWHGDFTLAFGRLGWVLWKMGLLGKKTSVRFVSSASTTMK